MWAQVKSTTFRKADWHLQLLWISVNPTDISGFNVRRIFPLFSSLILALKTWVASCQNFAITSDQPYKEYLWGCFSLSLNPTVTVSGVFWFPVMPTATSGWFTEGIWWLDECPVPGCRMACGFQPGQGKIQDDEGNLKQWYLICVQDLGFGKTKNKWKDSSLLSSSSLCLNVKIFFSRERSHGKSEEKLWRGWRGKFAD